MDLWRALADVVELLAPRRCAGCDGEMAGYVARAAGLDAFCEACAPLLDRVQRAAGATDTHAAFLYGGPMADAVRRLKYHGRSELGPALGALLVPVALEVLAGRTDDSVSDDDLAQVDRVVPVPLHASRLGARGYNQAALLARPVARALGVPLDTASLLRARPNPPQVGRTAEDRARQVRHAFTARSDLAGARLLLVDDVLTTGATIRDARRALMARGARSVLAVALAQTP